MTSHTPQPPAGDDLVARLREVEEWFHGRRSGKLEAARIVRETIEALTSQQHTEPVAGEVARYDFDSGQHAYGTDGGSMYESEDGEWIKAADYDALLAAKARAEEEYLRAWNERDAQRRRAEDAERERDNWKGADKVSMKALVQQRERAEAAERQRDALLDVSADALDEHDTSHGEITDPGDPHWSVRARALKNEGSAT